MKNDDLLSTAEIAELFGKISQRRVLAILQDRGVEPVKTIGRNKLYKRGDIEKFKTREPGRPIGTKGSKKRKPTKT